MILDRKKYLKTYNKKYYIDNKDKWKKYSDKKEYMKVYRKANRKKLNEYTKGYYAKNKENYQKYARRQFKQRMKNKEIVFRHYGGKCICCGENIYEFLTIDHKFGDGAIERKEFDLRGCKLYAYIIKNNFPNKYQILCWNCNCSIGIHGYCPHKKEKAC